jgi:hypothetical protein
MRVTQLLTVQLDAMEASREADREQPGFQSIVPVGTTGGAPRRHVASRRLASGISTNVLGIAVRRIHSGLSPSTNDRHE